MKQFMAGVERVNGFGWFIGVIVNVIWTTIALAGLYWMLHEDVALVKQRQEAMGKTVEEIRVTLDQKVATRQEVNSLWAQGQEQHQRMWDAIDASRRRNVSKMDQSWSR